MLGGVAAVRMVPGRSQNGSLCRFNCGEKESLGHVLGGCRHNEQLIDLRHNTIRSMIAEELRSIGWTCHEEINCINLDGSTQRIDIICFKDDKKNAFILDPTIRMEYDHGDAKEHQADIVNKEKGDKYKGAIPFFQREYGIEEIEIIGLYIGARGTIVSFFENFRKKFGLSKDFVKTIVIETLKGSVRILHNHIHSVGNNMATRVNQ